MFKNNNLHIQEAQWTLSSINAKRPTNWHIVVKMLKAKDKEKVLKAVKEKWITTYKETPIRLTTDFSVEMVESSWLCDSIFIVLKNKQNNLSTMNSITRKLCFKNKEELQIFPKIKKNRTKKIWWHQTYNKI